MIQSTPNNITLTNGKSHVSSLQVPTKALLELESNTNLNKTLLALIQNSFFVKKPINWKPVKCELVVNTQITEEFQQIKSEFQANPEAESDEKYAFIIDTDAQINEIALNGYSCQDNAYNVIGQSKSGVYLCKYSDVAMKYSEAKKWPDNLTLKMIVFKICYGKQTLALVRKDAKLPPISATPNFSSHMSVIRPKETDEIETQFDHSQIYLYELNAQKQPTRRPRHCMPYAVITWLKFNDGTEWPPVFAESDADLTILGTDSLQLALRTTEDVYLQTKLKALLKTNVVNGDSTIHFTVNGDVHKTNGVTNGHNGTTNGHVIGNGTEQNGTEVNAAEIIENAVAEVNEETNGFVNEESVVKEVVTEPKVESEVPVENGVENSVEETVTRNEKEAEDNAKVGEQTEDTEDQTKSSEQPEGSTEPLVQSSKTNEAETKEATETIESSVTGTDAATQIQAATTDAPKNDQPTVAKTPTSSTTPGPANLTSSGPTVSPSTLASLQAHRTSLPHYSKPSYHQQSVYRHPSAVSLYAAQGIHPYAGISAYQARQMQLGGVPQQAQLGGQGQVFLVRGPNGQMAYVSAGGAQQQFSLQQQQHQQQQQLLLAQVQSQALQLQQQQAQYQQQQQLQAAYAQQLAVQQQQAAQAQQQVSQLTYAAGPTQYKQGAPVVQQSQIIYQSAPQPAQSQAGQAAAKPAGAAVAGPPPTQSPKQQHAAAQFAAAQFQQQQSQAQSAAAQSSNAQAAAVAQHSYLQGAQQQAQQQNLLLQAQTGQSTGTATQQQQQLQLQQQLALLQQQQQQAQQQAQQQQLAQQQQQQLLAYQQSLGVSGLALNGIHGQVGALGQQISALGGLQVPAGYQLVQSGYQAGAQPMGLTIEQLSALNSGIAGRARVVNLRHHPYQRNP